MKISPLAFVAQRWQKALILAAGLVVLAVFVRLFVLPYKLNAVIEVHDAQNSELQAFSTNFFGLSKTQAAPSRKSNTPADKGIDDLDRNETYIGILQTLKARAKAAPADWDKEAAERLESHLGDKLETLNPNERKIVSSLKDMINFSVQSPSEIKVTFSTPNKDLTYFMSKEVLPYFLSILKVKETEEFNKVQTALEKQRDYFKSQFMKVTSEVEQFQKKPQNVISLASGNNLGTYLSDLMVRKNELELKIAENQRTIEFLGGTKAANLAIARDLGQRSEIRQLIDETALLKKQVGSLQSSINKFTNQSGGTVEALRMYDELKKNADANFKSFQEANDILSKLVVYQISIENKFELFQKPEFEDVHPAMATTVLIALALLFSQIIFCLWTYFDWLALQKPREELSLEEAAIASHEEAGNWVVDLKNQWAEAKRFN